jgi:hypothetical protein
MLGYRSMDIVFLVSYTNHHRISEYTMSISDTGQNIGRE